MVRPLQACLSVLSHHCLLRRGGQHCGYLLKGGRVKPLASDQIMSWLNLSYVYTHVLSLDCNCWLMVKIISLLYVHSYM